MYKAQTGKTVILFIFLLSFTHYLCAEIITVPSDCPTLKKAISLAQDGDVVEVEDGIYIEENIIIDKKIHVRAKNLYGAIIQGTTESLNSIFIVRAETEIEGFVLLNAGTGILQRGSPDVTWSAHDLVIIDMIYSGISINDKEERIGFANLSNVIIDDSNEGFGTNDARGFDIRNCLITNCDIVFRGANHDSFCVDNISIFNCKRLYMENPNPAKPFQNNKIDIGPDIFILDDLLEEAEHQDFFSAYGLIYEDLKNRGLGSTDFFGNHQSFAFNIFGEVYFRLKRFDVAEEWCRRALILADQMNAAEINTRAYYNLARIAENREDYTEAINLYKKSIAGIEKTRTGLPLAKQRVGFLRSKIDIYESFIYLLLRQHERNPLGGYDREAFYFAEKCKARAFIRSLEESNINFEIHLDPELKAEKRDVLERMAELQRELHTMGLTQIKRQTLLDELMKATSDYESVTIQIKKEHPEYANLFLPQPFRYSKIQEELLDEETALLEFFIAEHNFFAFLATSDGLFVAKISESPFLSRLIDNYLLFLTLKETGSFRGIQGGHRLYELLIGPFKEQLRNSVKRLIVVPDGCLNRLPFETLVYEVENPGERECHSYKFLVEDYEISYSQSASLLLYLEKNNNYLKRRMDLLAVANKKSQKSVLHHVVREAKLISRFFKKERTQLLLKDDATEQNFKRLRLTDFKIVHLATHGIIDDEFWWRSALLFCPDKQTKEDGLLQPVDINSLEFDANLVVLSACQTGMGKIEKAEGILGFTRAFINAGAKSVLASLWEIDDRTTPQFMKYFYKFLLEGQNKSRALQLAKIKMIKSGFAHPFFWASFILFGESKNSIGI